MTPCQWQTHPASTKIQDHYICPLAPHSLQLRQATSCTAAKTSSLSIRAFLHSLPCSGQGSGAMTSGFGIARVILTSCQNQFSPAHRLLNGLPCCSRRPAPNDVLRSPHFRGYQMPLGLSGVRMGEGGEGALEYWVSLRFVSRTTLESLLRFTMTSSRTCTTRRWSAFKGPCTVCTNFSTTFWRWQAPLYSSGFCNCCASTARYYSSYSAVLRSGRHGPAHRMQHRPAPIHHAMQQPSPCLLSSSGGKRTSDMSQAHS